MSQAAGKQREWKFSPGSRMTPMVAPPPGDDDALCEINMDSSVVLRGPTGTGFMFKLHTFSTKNVKYVLITLHEVIS